MLFSFGHVSNVVDVLAYVFDGGAHTIKAGLTNLTEPM